MRGIALALCLVLARGADAQDLREAFLAIRDAQHVPALAGMLVKDDRVVATVAVGVRKAGDPTPVTPDDPFHLGSDTKAMTATLVAIAVDRGLLSWTSTLPELLPDIATMDPAFRDVTVEMLLAHRAGLGSEGTFDGGRLFAALRAPGLDPVDGRRRLAREMLSAPPVNRPGSTYAYANAGYVVIGAVLERITGRPWEVLMRIWLFEPLGMSGCGFGALGDAASTTVSQPWAHRTTEAGPQPLVGDNPATLGPAGTVYCPMADWMKFVRLHMDAFDGRPRLVGAASFLKLHTNWPGQSYTPGGWIRTERPWAGGVAFAHDGSNTLNYATVWWAPARRLAIVAVSNVGPPSGQKAASEAVSLLLTVAQKQ